MEMPYLLLHRPEIIETGADRTDIGKEAPGVPESDMSDAMITMALAMGDWVPE